MAPSLGAAQTLIEELQREVGLAREGFDGWAAARKATLGHAQQRHAEVQQRVEVRAHELRVEEAAYLAASKELQKLIASQQQDLEILAQELSALRVEEQTWPAKLADLQANAEQEYEENSEDKKELQDAEVVKKKKAEALTALRQKYKKYLGLDFEHAAKDRLKIVFTNIDHMDPERQFSFVLHVTDSYSVVECTPPIADMDDLLEDVNESNDFSLFVRSIRRRFQQTCGSAS